MDKGGFKTLEMNSSLAKESADSKKQDSYNWMSSEK